MNELTSRSRDAATPAERRGDRRSGASDDHARNGGERTARSRRRRSHDPMPGEIDVHGAPMAVDRCRYCGVVLLDPGRPGGPCPGPNHTLEEFGIRPPRESGRGERPIDRSRPSDPRGDGRRTTPPVLASR